MQHGFYFDHKRCVKCHACEIACKTWNEVDVGPRWREVVKIETGTFPNVKAMNVSMACMHCGDAPCKNACPVTAITKRADDGLVVVDRKDLIQQVDGKFEDLLLCFGFLGRTFLLIGCLIGIDEHGETGRKQDAHDDSG